jgi:hypothetical protein
VTIAVYDPNGQKVSERLYDNENFAANALRSFSMSWAVPNNAAKGTYTVRVVLSAPGGVSLYSSNSKAATFRVS